MHIKYFVSALLAPIAALAVPVGFDHGVSTILARQARPQKPPPCVRRLNTTEPETKTRSDAFAHVSFHYVFYR